MILIGRSDGVYAGVVPQSPPPFRTVLSFRILELLKGTIADSVILLTGTLVHHDEFNPGPVPYENPRPSALKGACFTHEYRQGAQYLLLLFRDPDSGGALSIEWAPLLPVNEQLRGLADPWAVWVRSQLGQRR